jgi:hypothetical protein
MRELGLEVLVGGLLVLLGLATVWLFVGDRALGMNLDLAYLIGSLVFSVPAIVILELRRRHSSRGGSPDATAGSSTRRDSPPVPPPPPRRGPARRR